MEPRQAESGAILHLFICDLETKKNSETRVISILGWRPLIETAVSQTAVS